MKAVNSLSQCSDLIDIRALVFFIVEKVHLVVVLILRSNTKIPVEQLVNVDDSHYEGCNHALGILLVFLRIE